MRISKLEVSIYGVYYGKEDLEMQEWNVYVTEDGLVTRPSYGVALRRELEYIGWIYEENGWWNGGMTDKRSGTHSRGSKIWSMFDEDEIDINII